MCKVCIIFSAFDLVHNTVYDNDSETNENTGTLKPGINYWIAMYTVCTDSYMYISDAATIPLKVVS